MSHCHNGGRDNGVLDLDDDSGVREKEIDLGAIHEVGLAGFHDSLEVEEEKEQEMKHHYKFLAWTTKCMMGTIY